jgi:hypothetical protein
MTFGYGTKEFEVTAERLGCYRPEDHIGTCTPTSTNSDLIKAFQTTPKIMRIISMLHNMTVDFEVLSTSELNWRLTLEPA